MPKYAQIAIGLPVGGPFTYALPVRMQDKILVGMRVWVPFRDKLKVGYVVEISDAPHLLNLKEIASLIDEEAVLGDKLLELTEWISRYYFCSWGEAIEAVLPSFLKKGRTKTRKKFEENSDFVLRPHLKPTFEQEKALKLIIESLRDKRGDAYLLHGVTGSGKTEVYLQAIDFALAQGRSCIVLVPEIALTPQAVERFKERFGMRVAVLHSKLTEAQKYYQWKRIKEGTADVVLGARSAVFAPVKELGLIVVDEEQENTYKQQDVPRYNVQEVSIQRVKQCNAVLIFGGATPSLETYYKAVRGEYRLLKLTKRVEAREMPAVEIVDMRIELQERKRLRILSRRLEDGIKEVLVKKEQIMLFINRRGFSTFVSCQRCGYVVECKRCSVSMKFHFDRRLLICHYCNYRLSPPDMCPKCNKGYLRYLGIGTEKVENEIKFLFPGVRTARMDSDTTVQRGSHDRILGAFKRRETDILIGTQMIAKGHDFPNVTLVGVVLADSSLNMPDFRAGERTFNLLTQVAGRAGRGDIKGRVIIQTYTPEHYSISCAKEHNYESFYVREIEDRRQLGLPPFSHIIEILLRAGKEEKVQNAARALETVLREWTNGVFEIMGTAPAVLPKLRGQFRWTIVLTTNEVERTCEELRAVLGTFGRKGAFITVDVDSK